MAPLDEHIARASLPADERRGSDVLIWHSVLTTLAIIVIAFRSVAKHTTSGLKPDDYCMMVALVTVIINFVLNILNFHNLWRHTVYLTTEELIGALRTLFVGEFMLLLGLCLTKVSVILFLLNFGGLKKWLRWTLNANMFVICASTLAFIVTLWVQCKPVQANWDPTVPGATCISISVFMNVAYAVTAITFVTDLLCVLLPLPIIWELKLGFKTKVSLTAMLGLGLFAAACCLVRLALVKYLEHSRTDPTWLLMPLGLWTLIELHVAMIVASLPPCRALGLRIYKRIRGQSQQTLSYESRSVRSSGKKFVLNEPCPTGHERDDGWIRMGHFGEARSEFGEVIKPQV